MTPESAPLAVTGAGVLANDSDPDGDPLTAVIVTQPAHGTVNLYAGGSFNYVPTAYFVGTDSFTYQANDGTLSSAPATVTVSVTPVNFPPVAFDDAYHGFNEGSLTIAAPGVLLNDVDPDGDPITASLVTGPSHGTLTLAADGGFVYAATAGFTGTDYFSYRASDGTLYSPPSTAAITIVPASHGSAASAPVDEEVAFLPDAVCTATRDVQLVLHAHNASAFMVSDDREFKNAVWAPRNDQTEPAVIEMTLPEGDGSKVVYAKFRSPGGVESPTVTATILLDQAGKCGTVAALPAPTADTCAVDFAAVDFHPYLVIKGGREVHDGDPSVTFTQLNPAWREWQFADPGRTGSGKVVVQLETIGTEADLHVFGARLGLPDMQLRLRVHDRSRILDDVLLWEDARDAIGQSKDYDARASLARCHAGTSLSVRPGDLLKGRGDAVYFIGQDRKRHVFPDRTTYDSWYKDFSGIRTLTDEELSAVPLGANVRIKPGARLVKIVSDPKVYAIGAGGRLQWVRDEAVAAAIFGDAWAKSVVDVDPSLLPGYGMGAVIGSPGDYDASSPAGIDY